MKIATPRADTPPAVITAARLISVAVVCAILYWGQIVLIPIALAALVTFLMSPLVTRLGRWGLPRLLAVLIVAGSVTTLLGGLGYVVAGQLGELAAELPAYRENIRTKVADLRALTRGGTLESVQRAIEDISEDIERDAAAESAPEGGAAVEEPVRVAIERDWVITDATLLGPLFQAAATGGIAMLLSIFMLLKREDLRNRLVSLAGEASLAVTTKAFADAGERISRFLLMQFIINATMGLAVGTGLYLIGVPYAALWGLSAALLRYIPYVGPWVAALLPIAVSVVTAPGWEQVVMVIGLFIVLELLSNNVMEPWLYGQSVGISTIAVIVSAVFWTWLWGPVGLLLATPITACIVVFSRYVPELGALDRLLSERPALQPHLWLYQRLLARDDEEAAEIIEDHLAEHSLEETCDELLLGALLALKRDLAAGRLSADDGEYLTGTLRALIDDLPNADDGSRPPQAPREPAARLIGFPVGDGIDELALHLLRPLLRKDLCAFEILSPESLIGERIAAIETQRPAAVCLVSLPPGDIAASRHASKRLRARLPSLALVVARLGSAAPRRRETALEALAPRDAVSSLTELRDALERVVPAAPLPPASEPPQEGTASDALAAVR
jgi:predicted PurR-regulated permease PerM